MRAVVQRVARARATPGGEIGPGLCVLLGVAASDDEAAAERLAGKVARLRIFEGDDGRFDRSLLDAGGAALVYGRVCAALRGLGVPLETGVFGARMEVELVNDGPATIVLDA